MLGLWIGVGKEQVEKVRTGVGLKASHWYSVGATYDAASGKVCLCQEPIARWPIENPSAAVEETVRPAAIGENSDAFLMAAYWQKDDGDNVTTAHFNGKIDGPLQLPAVAFFDQMLARRHFHDDALDAGIDGAFDVVDHAAGEGINFRAEISLGQILDDAGVIAGDHGHARLDAVDTDFRQSLGDADLIVVVKRHAGLLLAVAQCHVMNLNFFGELPILGHLGGEVPEAGMPICI